MPSDAMSYYEFHVSRRYVQFEGALNELPRYASSIGKKILILVASIPERVEETIRKAMLCPSALMMQAELGQESSRYADHIRNAAHYDDLRRGMSYEFYEIVDEIPSVNNIRAVADYVRSKGFDTVVGIGGGRGLDFARAITHFVPVKVILVPTLAATNAPISTLSVIYSEDGSTIEDYWRMDNAPDLTLVDTSIIIDNPRNALAAGIGDITCTYYEGLTNLELSHTRKAYPELSYRGLELAVDIMKKNAADALNAVSRREITPAFESVVSMIMHNCGPLWTACSMGLAHAIDEVFLYFPQAHKIPHGLRVGFAAIPMLEFAGWDAGRIGEYISFCREAGIPTSLREMNLGGISAEQWKRAAAATIGRRNALASLPYKTSFEEVLPHLLKYEE